jgi:hypothetical protein
LGILIDRIADRVFCKLSEGRIRKKYFGKSVEDHQNARRTIALASPQLYAIRQYACTRTRIRICRGWALNSIALAAAGSWHVWREFGGDLPALLFLDAIACLVLLGSVFAWISLVESDYGHVKRTAMFIESKNAS